MKKNRMMRLASLLLVLVLMTSSVVGGTFAKYTTKVEADDSARVAKWGFGSAAITFENLFASSYDNVANGDDTLAIIAPGTAGSVIFKFENSGNAPEVAYELKVDAKTGSAIDASIESNPNIVWQLDNKGYGTWDEMITAIEALSQDRVEANALPTNFGKDAEHTVSWKWIFDENAVNKEADTDNYDDGDTDMGDAAVSGDLKVTLKITITATQID